MMNWWMVLFVFSLCLCTCMAHLPSPTTPTTRRADDLPTTRPFASPFIRQRADPFVTPFIDGHYVFTASVPAYDRIVLRRATTIEGLASAQEKTVWTKHPTGEMGVHIWAPEIHQIDGKWYIYFAAGRTEDKWAIRIYVLENASANPLEGEWVERGQLKTQWDTFSLDATTFAHRGIRYLVWAQHDPAMKNNTDLYIAKMDSPTRITGTPVRISRPDLAWEKILFEVNEGPAVLIRNGKIFMAYSASGTDHNYCMGLLTADENADLLDPVSWTKSPEPVFKTDASKKRFGPGHNSFTTTPDGKTDLMVYHARDYKEIVGDPLNDPNRHANILVVRWDESGAPVFDHTP
jgi:GH43 family beta-xylosidase